MGKIQNTPLSLEKGVNRIIGRTITAGDYNVRYNNTGSGLIVYNFQRKAPEPDEVPVYVPANEPATDRNKEKYTPKETASDWSYGWVAAKIGGTVLIVGGTALVVWTYVEDVATFGVGIVDDAPTTAAGIWTISNGLKMVGAY